MRREKESGKNLNWKDSRKRKRTVGEKNVSFRGEERSFEWVQNVIPLKRRESKLLEFE
jgi:hypothetical protein